MILLAAFLAAAPMQSQTAMNETSTGEIARADAALNVQYRLTMAAMKKMDGYDAPDAKTGPTYQAALLASQRAWLAFRDAECLVEGYRLRGGSAQNMTVVECATSLTNARIVQLKSLAK